MLYLLAVSLLWAFSFGLIKQQLTGLDSNLVSFIRMGIAFLVFLPFLRLRNIQAKRALVLVGTIQFGLMYMAYIWAYRFLLAYEVALFTIFTPVYVTLIDDLFRKRFQPFHFAVAVLAVIGTGIIIWHELSSPAFWKGFILIQFSNLFFAFGQIYYRKLRGQQTHLTSEASVFALLYLGALLITGFFAAFTTQWATLHVSTAQWLTLIYLGAVASGVGFFLWNFGATKVNAGTLSVFNNLKIPTAILVAILFFGEKADIVRLLIGGSILIGALAINERRNLLMETTKGE